MRVIFIGLISAASLAVWAADKLPTLNIKTGLWETTMTTTTSGSMPIPPDLLAKLTPEQRAKMEASTKANSAAKTRTLTYKSCITKERLEKGADFGKTDDKCTQTVVTSTTSEMELRITCDEQYMKSSGTMHFEALSPESLRGSGQMQLNGGSQTMTVNTNLTAKWIGSECGEFK